MDSRLRVLGEDRWRLPPVNMIALSASEILAGIERSQLRAEAGPALLAEEADGDWRGPFNVQISPWPSSAKPKS